MLPEKTLVLADMEGPGCVKRIWMTLGTSEKFYPRKSVLRMFWDNSEMPAVEVPVGDFFGIGHGRLKNFSSLPLAMSPESGKSFNCYFPMPFNSRGRIELENQGEENLVIFFNIDWEKYPRPLDGDIAHFHAAWRRENPTLVAYEVDRDKPIFYAPQWGLTEYGEKLWNAGNLTGKENYVILEAEGNGHYVGCNLNIDCFERQVNDWYGEGDEMIFIDGEPWPPRIHGTGTEDYFNTAYCPTQEFCTPYYGIPLYGGKARDGRIWGGKHSMYRFHVEDPVRFEKSIKGYHRAWAQQCPGQRLQQHGILVSAGSEHKISTSGSGQPTTSRANTDHREEK